MGMIIENGLVEMLKFIQRFEEDNDRAPTMTELGDHLGLKSPEEIVNRLLNLFMPTALEVADSHGLLEDENE